MLDVLEHLDRPEAALRQARTLLEPEGLLLITVPAFRILWTNHDILNQHQTRFTKASLRKLAEETGFRVLSARYFFLRMFPAKLLVRAKEFVLGSSPKVARVPAQWLNRMLWKLSGVENKLAFRFSLTLGSSLLVLAARSSEDLEGT